MALFASLVSKLLTDTLMTHYLFWLMSFVQLPCIGCADDFVSFDHDSA